jgi:hypothetical protein
MKRADNGNWQRKDKIALSRELAVGEAVDLSSDRKQNEWMNQ